MHKLPDGSAVKFNLPDGVYPELVGWRQGNVYRYQDLITGDRVTTKTPLFGKVPTKGGPLETLRIIRTGRKKPRQQNLPMGIVAVTISERSLTFRRSSKAKKFPRARGMG